jgi:hypothetical protein
MIPHASCLVVAAGAYDPDDGLFDLARGEFHGTANLFITAAHVYEDAAAAGTVALGRLTPGKIQGSGVRDFELFPEIDVAILACSLDAEILELRFGPPLYWLDDVFAFGWGFGMSVAERQGESHQFQLRAFKGHVVNRRGLDELPGRPPGYELSFVPPPGLSGAPLMEPNIAAPRVRGIMLKHHSVVVGERRMDLGLAVDVEELLTIESRLTNGSFAGLYGLPKMHRTRRDA